MKIVTLVLALISLYHAEVEAAHDDQEKCLNLHPERVTADLLNLMLKKKWWYYFMTPRFAGYKNSRNQNLTAPVKESYAMLTSFKYHSNNLKIATVTKYLHLGLDNGSRGNSIVAVYYHHKQTDSKYAVYTGEAITATMFYSNGESRLVAARIWMKAYPTPESKTLSEFALVHAEDKFMIFRTCDLEDFIVLLSKNVVDEIGGVYHYHDDVFQKLHELGITVGNRCVALQTKFPFDIEYDRYDF